VGVWQPKSNSLGVQRSAHVGADLLVYDIATKAACDSVYGHSLSAQIENAALDILIRTTVTRRSEITKSMII